ncbi:MAG: DNA-directed RNA polymerase subunit omega [Clostridia bacterium]
MFNPDLREVLDGGKSRYSLVTAVARRAREVSENEELTDLCGTEKPVTFALNEFLDGDLEFQEADELRLKKEGIEEVSQETQEEAQEEVVILA